MCNAYITLHIIYYNVFWLFFQFYSIIVKNYKHRIGLAVREQIKVYQIYKLLLGH